MGHQPLSLAAPAAALRARGHAVDALDLAVDPLDEGRVRAADLIALSIPMHTASRLALQLVPQLRALRPDAAIALYGLYAGLLGDLRASGVVDAVAGGEYEPALCDLADRIAAGDGLNAPAAPDAEFERQHYPVPDRSGLPALDRYAQLQTEDGFAVAGYVEATRGCAHQCLHCPVTAAYDGRLRLVPARDGARRRRPASGGRRRAHHLRRPRLPERRPALARDRRGAARTSPLAELRRDD